MKGATFFPFVSIVSCYVSIHAPMKGATISGDIHRYGGLRFNPRAHEGRDWSREGVCFAYRVSIHAPMKGATLDCLIILRFGRSFNPRAHEGRD